jgi:hypothetical protein
LIERPDALVIAPGHLSKAPALDAESSGSPS